MSDLEPPANNVLTEGGPNCPDGSPDGPSPDGLSAGALPGSPAAPDPPEGASKAAGQNTAPPAVPAAQTAPSAAHLLGLPDSLPITWCPNCKADVLPKGKGYCPRCGRLLKGAFLARRHPVNILRRDQLLAKFVHDYRPDTQRLQSMCEQYAGVIEQLETLKPGSQEHKRLVELSQMLGTALEDSRSTTQVVHEATEMDHLSVDQLIEKTAEIARDLLALRDSAVPHSERATHEEDAEIEGATSPPATAPEPAPEPVCQYCRRLCVGPEHSAYSVLHWNDPSEVERRRQEATKEMMRPGAGRLPEWYR